MVDETGIGDLIGGDEPPRRERQSISLGVLIFAFGTTAGFMAAFAGLGVIEDSAGLLLLVFLTALMFIAAFGLMVYLFRKPLLRRLFGFAETQLELFARPLSNVAKRAVDRDPQGAVDAAREIVQLALARYAWLSTRRWIIGSLTGLIAAMAALAGTAMLFRQNVLLQEQTVTLNEQNARIDAQIVLTEHSVQLAEAARNAELVAAIIEISGDLGRAAETAAERPRRGGNAGRDAMALPLIDPTTDLDLGLIARIISASQATKPYRYLDLGLSSDDDQMMLWYAVRARRDELPVVWERVKDLYALPPGPTLIDRPASPERGQLLVSMVASGIHGFELFNARQLDLSYAVARGIELFICSFQIGNLRFADFSHATVRQCDFGAAFLENARFRKAWIDGTTFAPLDADRRKPLLDPGLDGIATGLAGADFSGAYLTNVDFSAINGSAMVFKDATLAGVKFTGASINATNFRGALILDATFDGAELARTDFDGAFVTGQDAAARIEAVAAGGTFAASDYWLEPVDLDDVIIESVLGKIDPPDLEALAGPDGFFRMVRLADGG